MTRFVLDFTGPATGELTKQGGIAQAKVIVALEPAITALKDEAKKHGLTLTGEPRFVPEHKKGAAPPASTVVTTAPPPADVSDITDAKALAAAGAAMLPEGRDAPAVPHGRRHGQAAAE
jgi:hypothetical protein